MLPRSNGNISLTSTDVLIAMLSSDLRGTWLDEGFGIRAREHVDPAASQPMPVMGDPSDPEDSIR
jgi:hypothetical protein